MYDNGSPFVATWQHAYGGEVEDKGISILEAPDNGFFLLANSMSNKKRNQTIRLLKINSSGEPIWEKYYGGTEDDAGNQIIATSDGGYAVIGTTESNEKKYKTIS